MVAVCADNFAQPRVDGKVKCFKGNGAQMCAIGCQFGPLPLALNLKGENSLPVSVKNLPKNS